jgi:hypothetical protein
MHARRSPTATTHGTTDHVSVEARTPFSFFGISLQQQPLLALPLPLIASTTCYNRGRPPVKWLREEDERLQRAIEAHGEVSIQNVLQLTHCSNSRMTWSGYQ